MKPKIALNINQMKGLAALGLDISDASLCWVSDPNDSEVKTLCVHDEYCYKCSALNPVPAYTLEDVLLKMSTFTLDCPENTYDNLNVYDCFIGADFVCTGNTPLDAAYHALVWLASHHQEYIVRLSNSNQSKTVES